MGDFMGRALERWEQGSTPPALAGLLGFMFGKPHWFRKRVVGWGLVPVTWQAWVYGVAWYGVILVAGVWPWLRGDRVLALGLVVVLTVGKLVDMKLIRDRIE